MDDFEKYIKEHKTHFEEHTVDKAKVWQNISQQLDPPEVKTRTLWSSPFLKIAASILIILSIGIGGVLIRTNTVPQQHIVHEELNDVDSYYQELISFQVQLVKKNTKLLPEEKEEFLSFMNELDEEYLLLKEEMNHNLNNEYILEAIVNNYKKRIELIENLLEQINHAKKSYDDEGYTL